MAEAEEQAPVSPQSEGRSGAGEDAPERTPESGAALGVGEPATSPAGSPGTEEPAGDAKKKIDVLLKAVGDTPIMKTKKWAVERTRTIQGLCDFIKKFLKLMASEQLFIYVNQSFAPSPDQEVGTLYEVTFVLNVLEAMASLYYIIAKARHGDESQAIELLRCDLQNGWTDFLGPNTQKKEFGDFCLTVHLGKVMQLNSMKEELLRLSNCIAFH